MDSEFREEYFMINFASLQKQTSTGPPKDEYRENFKKELATTSRRFLFNKNLTGQLTVKDKNGGAHNIAFRWEVQSEHDGSLVIQIAPQKTKRRATEMRLKVLSADELDVATKDEDGIEGAFLLRRGE